MSGDCRGARFVLGTLTSGGQAFASLAFGSQALTQRAVRDASQFFVNTLCTLG